MSENTDPRVGEIQARMAEVIWAHLEHHGDEYDLAYSRSIRALTDNLTELLTAAGFGLVADAGAKRDAAPADVAYLLAELADRDEKLAKVEALAERCDFDSYADTAMDWEARKAMGQVSEDLRAAVAAANGGGE